MYADGFYRAHSRYNEHGELRLVPRDGVRYESVFDALSDNDTYERSDPSSVVIRYASGRQAEIFVSGSCCKDTDTFTLELRAACQTCNEQYHHDGALHTTTELAALWGAPVVALPKELLDPIRIEHERKRIREKLERLRPHLDELAQPELREAWLARHHVEEGLHVALLNAMIATGSVLGEHRDAARTLAREIADEVRPLLPDLEKDARMAHAAGFIEIVLDLSELQ